MYFCCLRWLLYCCCWRKERRDRSESDTCCVHCTGVSAGVNGRRVLCLPVDFFYFSTNWFAFTFQTAVVRPVKQIRALFLGHLEWKHAGISADSTNRRWCGHVPFCCVSFGWKINKMLSGELRNSSREETVSSTMLGEDRDRYVQGPWARKKKKGISCDIIPP